MTWPDRLDETVRVLRGQGLRAALSSAGIVVGVGTVITALAIAEGARREAIAEIGALGIDNVFIRAVPAPVRDGDEPPAPALTLGDRDAIAAAVPGAQAVAAVRAAPAPMSSALAELTAPMIGVTPDWQEVSGVAVARGRWLNAADNRTRRRVAVVGAGLASRLFGARDPLGAPVRAGGSWYVVVGVLDDRGGQASRRSSLVRIDPDAAFFVPFAAMDQRLGAGDAVDRVEEIALRAEGAGTVDTARLAAEGALRRRHPGPAVWETMTPRALLEARLRTQRTFNLVVLASGVLALLISGVGIMNVMLASVSERVTEIGLRRAVGATRSAILLQFSLESGALTLAGGACGVALGAVMSAIVALAAGWPVVVSASAVGLAVLLAVATGLVFGSYPAIRAARLDPAAALRAE